MRLIALSSVSVALKTAPFAYDLRAGMFADFVITIAPPKRSVAVPQNAIVRQGDGSMTVWAAQDQNRFVMRIVKTGLVWQGMTEILAGLQAGELAVTDGALFIANKYANGAFETFVNN